MISFFSTPWLSVSQDCTLCGVRGAAALCADCARSLPRQGLDACAQCGAEVVGIAANARCGTCLQDPPWFDHACAAYRYAYPLDRLLQSYKFNANLALVDLFGDAICLRLSQPPRALPDLILPMPLAAGRLATRGFNQASLIAARVAKRMRVALQQTPLLRVRETPPQTGLSRDARRKNVKGAFACDGDVSGRSIAIIDDVMTTGATLSEAARALKESGAVRVEAWVLARAQLRDR